MKETTVNRKFKDKLFRMLFNDKEALLSLFNAVNGTFYDENDEIIINTLEQCIYLEGHNDLSFIFLNELNMYEHQSTYSPNMPIRYLEYIYKVLKKYIALKEKSTSLFSSKQIKIPEPKCIVFYNGVKEMPEVIVDKLSDAYIKETDTPNLELTVVTLNINYGYNKELMDRCPVLKEYSMFVDVVRRFDKEMDREAAMRAAVGQCIEDNILRDFLIKNGGREEPMSIFDLCEEEFNSVLRDEREIGEEIGFKLGAEQAINEMIKNMLDKNLTIEYISELTGQTVEYILGVQDMRVCQPV